MNRRDCVLAAINHEEPDRVPYTLGFEGGTDEELDAHLGSARWRDKLHDYLQAVASIDTTGGTTWEGTADQKKSDDIYAEDAFGSLWRMDRMPSHLETPALSGPSVDLMTWPTSDKFPIQINDDVDKCTGSGAEDFSFCNIGWGLFEHSWRIRGFENVMMDCVAEPDFYGKLLDKIMELHLSHVEKCRDVPADAIMFGDDWGGQRGVIIGPERWRKFLKPRWAEIYDAVHAQGQYVISHSCGSVAEIMPDIIEIGLDVLESVQPEAEGMDSFELKKKYGDKITFWGCLGSQSTIPFGTPDEIRKRVKDLCEVMSKGGGFILAPAKPIQPGTPVKNMVATVEAFAAI